ncbi:spore coat protein [Bacillus cabrialesii subsp. cabrialesii]|uniref:spore coat protein n=1 Tax=Bacillus cabrialesii TaxID=2487276 RepID=UPI003305ED7C
MLFIIAFCINAWHKAKYFLNRWPLTLPGVEAIEQFLSPDHAITETATPDLRTTLHDQLDAAIHLQFQLDSF